MENENITQIPENTLQDACPECDTPSRSQKGIKGFLQMLKSLSWKAWIVIAVVTALLIGSGLFLYDRLTNTYKTPLDRYINYMNSRNYSADTEVSTLNGFAEAEYHQFAICMDLSENYLEIREAEFEKTVRFLEKTYGKDYKFYYKIVDKSKLTRDERQDYEDKLKDTAGSINELLAEIRNFDSDEWEEFAEAKDMSVLQAKLYTGALRNLYKELKSVDVTDGYELTVTIILKGSKLDEPLEHDQTMYVYKANGRWICDEFLENVFSSMQ